jgi:hypothetical protein
MVIDSKHIRPEKLSAQAILKRWQDGTSTRCGVVLDILSQSSKKVVTQAMEIIPADILAELEEFVGYYTPKTLIFNGPRPNSKTLRFVRDWFASRKKAASA